MRLDLSQSQDKPGDCESQLKSGVHLGYRVHRDALFEVKGDN